LECGDRAPPSRTQTRQKAQPLNREANEVNTMRRLFFRLPLLQIFPLSTPSQTIRTPSLSTFLNRSLGDLIQPVAAQQTSFSSTLLVFKYGFGFSFCLFGLLLLNLQHPYVTGPICLGFIVVGAFFLSVAVVKPGKEVLSYRI
jgi:hypothetical protein